ncbi:hypothetical protein [Bacillus pseudomycoides]|uniref:hypothetical protein n=1 Tax=Bacillus pseudomycoides TaxID=64104 RepID=UPI000BED424A|nr:hypothetical protein [Bacillus pseudomycoides]PED09610.1 hypothetical protein COO19_04120 [Bacillus pseudomycoides]PEE36316.1 hypothetical protein COO02_26035 [Bacillus pseudomycoides]PEI85164.1 hypothetical protein CN679_25060 [Bacillus pseudomycoides]PEI94882.1 hypothetical protein CN686_14885 [Bacillus pseudomycoides]PEK25987.1 hypothetical protein CN693_10150 [Bacillus pseudomycoides]
MKRKILFLLTFIYFVVPLQTSAFTFTGLPATSKSTQWYIKVDKTKNPEIVQSKEDTFHTYSLLVKNIGKDVSNVSVEIRDNNPKSKASFKPFNKSDMSVSYSQTSFTHMNFPLYEDVNSFEIVINWEETSFSYNGHPERPEQKYTQTFVFHNQ